MKRKFKQWWSSIPPINVSTPAANYSPDCLFLMKNIHSTKIQATIVSETTVIIFVSFREWRSSNKLPFIWPFHTPVCLFLSNVTFVSCWLLLFSPVSLRQSLLSHFLHPSYFYIYCTVVPSISQICNICRLNLILTLIFLYFSALEWRTFLQPCCKLFLFSNFL